MSRTIHFLGVPSSAGAHWPGQEKAPAALRSAGLLDLLKNRGANVIDRGDLPESRWRVDRRAVDGRLVNNLDATVAVAEGVANDIHAALDAGGFPVAIGGDCTITVGAVAGTLRAGLDPALLYVDGGWDLGTPESYPQGILDSMGAAHMLGVDGTTRLRDIGPRFPMLRRNRYVQFGHIPIRKDTAERPIIEKLALPSVPAEEAKGRGADAARDALRRHVAADRPYFLHFDVDVMSFFDFPVADVPEYDDALSFDDTIAAVGVFVADPRCVGITVTEFNPDHAHPDGREAIELAAALATMLAV
jgi:arginase